MKPLSSNELRELYQSFFESKKHVRIPSAPLIPENDPSVLFTTAGMHPLVPYLKGQKHPSGQRLTNVQKCLRTTDIDDVGDNTHATFFEMLGNWSLGDYFKEEAIAMSWEFLTAPNWLALNPKFLAVSVFAGDHDIPADQESAALWEKIGLPKKRIAHLDKQTNWWPAFRPNSVSHALPGGGIPGPQGPDTEMFYWTGKQKPPATFDPKDNNWVEIWNDVFMQYNLNDQGQLEELPQRNVDTGMGLARVIMVLNNLTSIYEIDTYQPLITHLQAHVNKPDQKHLRILADHLIATTFILGDEHPATPSSNKQGYVLRRLIRRAVRSAKVLGINDPKQVARNALPIIINQFSPIYPSLKQHLSSAQYELTKEIDQFQSVIRQGLKHFDNLLSKHQDTIAGPDAFRLYQTYGFPLELTQELAAEHGLSVDLKGFNDALVSHREKSRINTKDNFIGGLLDDSVQSTHYHTATHLLHQSLRNILGPHVNQRGSNITPERLRFDFSHPSKLTPEQIKQVEDEINSIIRRGLPVKKLAKTIAEARQLGAIGLFEHKYGDQVHIYKIGDYSIEICGGPHVKNTNELGTFKITKEQSASGGTRRIRAILEK